MPDAKKPTRTSHIPHVTNVRGSAAERNEIHRAGTERRSLSKDLLMPNDVSGEYDAVRALETTLGGQVRPITQMTSSGFARTSGGPAMSISTEYAPSICPSARVLIGRWPTHAIRSYSQGFRIRSLKRTSLSGPPSS